MNSEVERMEKVLVILESAAKEQEALNQNVRLLAKKHDETKLLVDAFKRDAQAGKNELEKRKLNCIAEINASSKKATERAQNELMEAMEKARIELEAVAKRTQEELKRVEKRTEEMNSLLEKLAKALKAQKSDSEGTDPKPIVIDYEEVGTLEELYNKYNGKMGGPVIVVALSWNKGYCFVIEELFTKEGHPQARGTAYKYGKIYETDKELRADKKTTNRYRMYNDSRYMNAISNAYKNKRYE